MASKKRKPAARKPASTTSDAVPSHRDPRRHIYGVLDFALGLIFAGVLLDVIPPRLTWVKVILWSMVVIIQVMAVAMLAPMPASEKLRRARWIAVVSAGGALLAVVVAVLVLLAFAAGFLSGVYGSFGKAAASGAMVGALLTIEAVAVIPALQLKFVMTRAGRRAFGLPPLWPRPSRVPTP